jgi:FecR-like protein
VSEEQRIEALLRDAGPRAAIPEEDLAAIRDSARIEWRRRYGDPASGVARRWWIPVAAAASVAIVVGLVALLWRGRPAKTAPPAPEVAAVIERVGADLPWKAGGRLLAGAPIETGPSGSVALRMAGGASVRVDGSTRLRVGSRTLVELASGAVYVDTAAGEAVAVRAPAGVFHPAGTQFEVRVEEGSTSLKVREGSVTLEGTTRLRERAAAGEELVVDAQGSIARHSIAPFGPEWEWVLAAAAVPDIEGMKVHRFLDWIAHEAGWRVEFADGEAASLADSVDLHGSVSHLAAREAIGVVLSSAGLEHRITNGALVVSVRR